MHSPVVLLFKRTESNQKCVNPVPKRLQVVVHHFNKQFGPTFFLG
jgi:hypothetical protein